MNFLYNLSISLLDAGARIAALHNRKVRTMLSGHHDTWDCLQAKAEPSAKYVWVHAASLGEFEQGRPLIELIRKKQPERKILLTFFSPSGYEVRKDYAGADIVAYLPFDHHSNARRLLDTVHIDTAIFVKYEFWGNYLQELHARNIPTYLVSAIFRPKQSFFQPWGGMFRKMLQCYTRLFVQDEASCKLLENIGVRNVTVAGDTRFDRVTDIMAKCKDIPAALALSTHARLTIVAGSTWPHDEDILLPYLNDHPDIRAIIAPHEVKEERLHAIESHLNGKSVRLSVTTDDEAASAQVLIIDCYGKLSSAYRYGRIAYIGGGFGAGIHNINEAAVYDMPVLFGPKYQKFKEAVDMVDMGAAFSFSNAEEFTSEITPLVEDSSARSRAGLTAGDYIRRNLGATERIYALIFPEK